MATSIGISNGNRPFLAELNPELNLKTDFIKQNPVFIPRLLFFFLFISSKLKVQNVRIDKAEPIVDVRTGSNQRIGTVSAFQHSIFVLSNEIKRQR